MNLNITPLPEKVVEELKAITEVGCKLAAGSGQSYPLIAVESQIVIKGITLESRLVTISEETPNQFSLARMAILHAHKTVQSFAEKHGLGVVRSPLRPSHVLFYTSEHGIVGLVNIVISERKIRLDFTYPIDSGFDQMVEELAPPVYAKPSVKRLSVSGSGQLRPIAIDPFIRPPIPRIMDLYPYLSEDPAALMAGFMASDSNVLVLIGEPGLGKSSFLGQMLNYLDWSGDQNNTKVYTADEPAIFEHPGITEYLRNLEDGSVFISEDTTSVCEKRENGNPLMSSLLGMTDGLIPVKAKFIFSTNLTSISKIDSALIRPGRTYRVLHFKRLSIEQANTAREAVGKPPIDFALQPGTSGNLTLSEALNWENGVTAAQMATGPGYR